MKDRRIASVVLSMFFLGVVLGCETISDRQILTEIQSRINADSGLRQQKIALASAHGTVTITGTVSSAEQSSAAASYASSVKGVKRVVNRLQIVKQDGRIRLNELREKAYPDVAAWSPGGNRPPTARSGREVGAPESSKQDANLDGGYSAQ